MTLLRISFHSIPADDQSRALAFYRDVLDFEVQLDVPYEADWRWIFLRIPGSDSRIQLARRAEMPGGDGPVLALASDDVDADCAMWERRGALIHTSPEDAPWQPGIRFATLRDSEGNLLFVESPKP